MSADELVEDDDMGHMAIENSPEQLSPHNLKRRILCPYGCNRLLAERTIQHHKQQGCRSRKVSILDHSSRKVSYCCGLCYAEFTTKALFFDHLSVEHGIIVRNHKKVFPTRALFDRFVRWLEKEGGAHFRQKSGPKNRSTKAILLACNRSGSCTTKGRCDVAPKNKTGPFRVGYTCTAYIHGVEYPNGTVCIEYCGDHYGHDARMRLPNIAKLLIAQKQLDGESATDILSYLHSRFSSLAIENIYAQRICMVDPDELRVIMTACTRKWENTGIPKDCEIWEEELLDAAGIVRRGVQRLRPLTDKTTDELAVELNWERPQTFAANLKSHVGESASSDVRHDITAVLDCNEYTQDSKPEIPIDVESVENGDEIRGREGVHAAVGSRNELPKMGTLHKASLLMSIHADIEALDKMVRFDSSQMNGASLIAFNTRIRALLNAYKSTINRDEHKFTPEMPLPTGNDNSMRDVKKRENSEENASTVASDGDSRLVAGIEGMLFNNSLWM